MKKIFYFIASAIVALGAVACQNEVDENITPGTQNDVVSFTVSFDDNTRIALDTVENGEASFAFEANETLYLNYNEETFYFTNTPENRNTFTGEGEGLSEIVKNESVLISNKEDLTSPSDVHTTFGEAAYFMFQGKIDGDVNLSLNNYVIHCITGADEVTLLCDSYKAAAYNMGAAPESLVLPANGEYWINLQNTYASEINVSYKINDETVKEATLDAKVNDAWGYKIFNLGTLAPVAYFNVTNNAGWDKTYLYAWVGTGVNEEKILGEWPGTEMKNGRVEIPNEYIDKDINFIINNGSGIQTRDLSTKFVSGYTHTIGDPDPENITIYLNNNWSVQDLKIHSWEPVLWADQTWENRKAPDGEITTEWGTFSYWNIDAKQIADDKTGNLLVTGTGKQTADLTNVNYSKDVYLQFAWIDNKDQLEIMTTPY